MVPSSQHRGWKQTPTLLPSQRSTKIITVDDICDMSLYITCHIVINFAEQPHLMLTKKSYHEGFIIIPILQIEN